MATRASGYLDRVGSTNAPVPKPGGALRIFTIIYVVQAAIGISAGVVYAVWLLYG